MGVEDCWSSAQRSLIAVTELSLFTLGFMQRFLREPRVRCLRCSWRGSFLSSDDFEGVSDGSIDGGNSTRRSSLMN